MSRDRASKEGAATYPVLSDRPVEVHNPQRKMRIIAAEYAIAVLVTAAVGAYIAATIAVDQSDDARRQLQAELDKRTKQRNVESDRFGRALEQYRRDQCTITGRLEQTPDIVEMRTRYRCTNPVTPPAAGSDPGPPSSSRSGGTGGSSTTPRARPAPNPVPPGAGPPAAPAPPQPAPGIPPAPVPPKPPPWLCLPLVGCIL